jgi:hypothetical protein
MTDETSVKLAQFDQMDDDEERYRDVHGPDSDDEDKEDKSEVKKKDTTGSWVHRKTIGQIYSLFTSQIPVEMD